MDIIYLKEPLTAEKHLGPKTNNKEPFYITEYGITRPDTPCYQLRMKSHVSCLQYVISGSGIIICNNNIYTVKSGDTFLLTEGSDQIYYSNPDNHFERIWINFKGELSKAIIDLYGLTNSMVFRNTDTFNLLTEIHKKCKSLSEPTEYKNESARIFLKTIQFLSNKKAEAPNIVDPAEKIRPYIDRHITENLKINEIAKTLNFTPEHIIRTFKQTYGITPHKYITQSKIRIAMIMLKSTDSSVEEISQALCFSDPHHFSYAFNKYTGYRPSVYRKNARLT